MSKRAAALDTTSIGTQDGPIVEKSLSASLAWISLPDCDGKETQLGSLWASQPTVLVFLRHYG